MTKRIPDPTPEEIAAGEAAIRAEHLEQLRNAPMYDADGYVLRQHLAKSGRCEPLRTPRVEFSPSARRL